MASYTQFFSGKFHSAAVDDATRPISVTREIELKLEIAPGDVVRLRRHPLLDPAGANAQPQLTVYYDTPAGGLQALGFSLRVRSAGKSFVQTVKPTSDSAGLVIRDEYESAVCSIEPELDALSAGPLRSLRRAGQLDRLEPVLRSQVLRTSWTVEIGGGRVRFDLDEGEMTAGGAAQRFNELELELLAGEPACLVGAARAIAELVPVRIGVLSKAERGALLARGAFERAVKAAPVRVAKGMSVAEAFEVMVHACLKHYRLNEPLVIARRDASALHQSRVALRRLRSAFTLFKSVIADDEYQFLREELRWFTNQLGDARNLDVFLERNLPDAERQPLIARREAAYDQVAAAMSAQRSRMLLLELVGWTAFGPWRSGQRAHRRVEAYAASRLDRLWKSITVVGHDLAALDEETRHELRIQIKKLRYAIEFLRGLYPAARRVEKRFAAAVADLQESLGKLNDLAIARTLVTAALAEDEWLVGPPQDEPQQLHLREAERAFRQLEKAGPFWRAARSAKHR